MSNFVSLDQVVEVSIHRFAVDASDLGLAPGQWPKQIQTNMGNHQPFIYQGYSEINQCAMYLQGNGCITLTVFND